MADTRPSYEIEQEILGSSVRVTKRAEIRSLNGSMVIAEPKVVGGSLSVDASRDERRSLSIEFPSDGLEIGPDGLWYDKQIVPYYGVETSAGSWEMQLGVFMVDKIDENRRDRKIAASCRDLTKLMLNAKLTLPVLYPAGTPVYDIIFTQATLSGVHNMLLPWNSEESPTLAADTSFDVDTPRFNIVKTIADAHAQEVFFDSFGYLVVREYQDPFLMPTVFDFRYGGTTGNVVSFTRSADDSELFNHVSVIGEREGNLPIFVDKKVTYPLSPVHESKIGDRVAPAYRSSLIPTEERAHRIAERLLYTASLQQYAIDLESIPVPWIEAGDVIGFIDPVDDSLPTKQGVDYGRGPTKWFLQSFDIPLGLGSMSIKAARLEVIFNGESA